MINILLDEDHIMLDEDQSYVLNKINIMLD